MDALPWLRIESKDAHPFRHRTAGSSCISHWLAEISWVNRSTHDKKIGELSGYSGYGGSLAKACCTSGDVNGDTFIVGVGLDVVGVWKWV
jgi:hypothetical protein